MFRKTCENEFGECLGEYGELEKIIRLQAEEAIPRINHSNTYKRRNDWWDAKCSGWTEQRRQALRRYKSSPTLGNYIHVERTNALVKRNLKRKKRKNFLTFGASINLDRRVDMVWRSIRSLAGTHRKLEYIQDEYVACFQEMLDGLTPLSDTNRLVFPEEIGRTSAVISKIDGLRKSAPGLDDIDNHMIKNLPDRTIQILNGFFNDIFKCPILIVLVSVLAWC